MSSDIKIVSIGSAVRDVFLGGKVLTPISRDGEAFIELPLGGKADLESINFSTGGGATNAAVTFARQGLKSSFMGQVGRDPGGQAILDGLKQEGVDIQLVIYNEAVYTGYSLILMTPDGERSIVTYRGASAYYEKEKFDMSKVHADWIYISTLDGDMSLLEKIITHASARHIKIALNPGKNELKEKGRLLNLLDKISILSANKEETAMLFDADNCWDLVKKAADVVPVVVVTDGPNGVVAGDRNSNQICSGGMYEDVPVIDRTGAGDAFASGFTAKMAMGAKLHDAVVFGSANSTSVVGQIGAKTGILHADVELHGMDLHCENLY